MMLEKEALDKKLENRDALIIRIKNELEQQKDFNSAKEKKIDQQKE